MDLGFKAYIAQRRVTDTPTGDFVADAKSDRSPAGDLLMFAGLWEGWRESPDVEWVHTYTVITGEPGKVSGDIHDRQPVILPPDLWEVWAEGTPADAQGVLAAVPEADLVYHPVPKAVGSPRNKGPELVEPVEL